MDPLNPQNPVTPAKPAAPKAPAFSTIRTMGKDMESVGAEPTSPAASASPTTPIPSTAPRPTTATEPRKFVGLEDMPPRIEMKPVNPFSESNKSIIEEVAKEVPQSNPLIRPIRTYTADVADAVKGGASLTKIATAESQRRAEMRAPIELEGESKGSKIKSLVVILISLALLGGGGYGIYYLATSFGKDNTVNVNVPKGLIISESTEYLALQTNNKDQWTQTLRNTIDTAASNLGSIQHLKIITPMNGIEDNNLQPEASTQAFFSSIQASAPNSLIRALDPSFYFGIHVISGNQPFIIFKVTSFENALAGMLAWESGLIKEAQTIFLRKDDRAIPPFYFVPGTSQPYTFEDAVFQNKDLRVIKNSEGRVIFMYSFVDRNTLILTSDDGTLKEVSERLIKARFVR